MLLPAAMPRRRRRTARTFPLLPPPQKKRSPPSAIRIPGAVTREKLDILRKADALYLEEIRNAGLYDAIWLAFAVLLPMKTVGLNNTTTGDAFRQLPHQYLANEIAGERYRIDRQLRV